MSFRKRPLQTCGVSFLAIAHSAYSKVKELDGRLGSITRRMDWLAKLMSPLFLALQNQCLLLLSIIDDRLLAITCVVEKSFPPSRLVFDKIDEHLQLVETFPGKFDDAVNKFPCFNQAVFLDWAVVHAISLLEFFITTLMNWGRKGTSEKEILIDINCNNEGCELADKPESGCCSRVVTLTPADETEAAKTGTVGVKIENDIPMPTYKEVLVTNPVENEDNKEDCDNNRKDISKSVEKGMGVVKDKENSREDKMECRGRADAEEKEEIADQCSKVITSDCDIEGMKLVDQANDEKVEDEIFELFESAWLMKPMRKGKGNLLSRSSSYA